MSSRIKSPIRKFDLTASAMNARFNYTILAVNYDSAKFCVRYSLQKSGFNPNQFLINKQ